MKLVRQKPTLKLHRVHQRFKYLTRIANVTEMPATTAALEALLHLPDSVQTRLIPGPQHWSSTLWWTFRPLNLVITDFVFQHP